MWQGDRDAHRFEGRDQEDVGGGGEEGGRGAMAAKQVIARHGGKHLFKIPPEVSQGCKCCAGLLGGETPRAPYLKGAFRSTILICPSTRL